MNNTRNTQNTQQRQNINRQTSNKPVKPKYDYTNPDPNAVKGCLGTMCSFVVRSTILSIAIYLAMRFLGLVGGNDLILKKESMTGPATFACQEYEVTDEDLEVFTALMNEELVNEEQKAAVYSLGK